MHTRIPGMLRITPRTADITAPQADKKSTLARPVAFPLDGVEGFDHGIGDLHGRVCGQRSLDR